MISLIVAVTKDFFIADLNGNGNFSSLEDKKQLRAYLHSSACDCFICGRKTAVEFKERLTFKPLFVFSKRFHENIGNLIFVRNIPELFEQMTKRKLINGVLLGGVEIYDLFLKEQIVDEVRITKENLIFQNGKKFSWENYQSQYHCEHVKKLSSQTKLYFYRKKTNDKER